MKSTVHLLWFVTDKDKNEGTELLIGVYSSDAEARAAIERLKGRKGFVEFPQGFKIHTRELDQDHWTEGFVRD